MYASLFRNLRLLYSGGIEKRRLLSDLEQSQWQSQEELEAQKLIQIQKLLKYAHENVPYYQNLFNRLDINPADVKCFNDFSSLPFLTKEN
jgi:phenylacetate-CoA ligase